jgi:TonB family protein
VLRVGVSTEGLPASAVATSNGHSALDQAALAAMQRWHSTRRQGGMLVAGTVELPFEFRLED